MNAVMPIVNGLERDLVSSCVVAVHHDPWAVIKSMKVFEW